MQLWKVHQEIYHRLREDRSDDAENFEMRVEVEILPHALAYFRERSPVAIYPAKSYAVAIIYAYLLARHYGEDFYTVLNDPQLLYGNDPYFVPYQKDPATYDAILTALGYPELDLRGGWAPYTVRYFYAECMGLTTELGELLPC